MWPGADYSRRVLILGDGKHAAVEVPAVGYEKVRWHGREAIVWNTSTTGESGKSAARAAYATGTHEGFHFYEQRAYAPASNGR